MSLLYSVLRPVLRSLGRLGRSVLWSVYLCLGGGLAAQAAIDVYQFEDETLRTRYQAFIEELRCPKCQNQNLAGSDSPIAADLRRELRRLLEEGRSDKEIVDFMVSRYGDYVLYRPQVQRNTLLLWGLPAGLLLAGGVVLLLIVRQRGRQRVGAAELDAEHQKQLAELLQQAAARDTERQQRG